MYRNRSLTSGRTARPFDKQGPTLLGIIIYPNIAHGVTGMKRPGTVIDLGLSGVGGRPGQTDVATGVRN